MGRFALCPYFMSEKKLSISCEDTVRQFYTKADKLKRLREHCDSDWKKCPHADALNKLYERMDEMKTQRDRDIAALEHLAQARKKENEELRQRLGYVNARNQSLEMMLGYLCDKYGVSEVDVQEMTAFFGKYTVNWKKTSDSKIVIEKAAKKNGR
jgi:hypothetical protein